MPRDYTLVAFVSAVSLVDGLLDTARGNSAPEVTASHTTTVGVISRHAPPA